MEIDYSGPQPQGSIVFPDYCFEPNPKSTQGPTENPTVGGNPVTTINIGGSITQG